MTAINTRLEASSLKQKSTGKISGGSNTSSACGRVIFSTILERSRLSVFFATVSCALRLQHVSSVCGNVLLFLLLFSDKDGALRSVTVSQNVLALFNLKFLGVVRRLF